MIGQLVDVVQQALHGNQFFAGGLVLGMIGGLIALLHRVPSLIWNSLLRRITVTIVVTNRENAFFWLQKWLAEQGYTKRARRWIVSSGNDNNGVEVDRVGGESRSPLDRPDDPPITLAPAPGQHFFRYKRKWIWLGYDREPMRAGGVVLGFLDTMTIRVFGRDQSVASSLLQEAYDLAVPRKEGLVTVYVAMWGSWRVVESRDARPMDSLVFDNDLANWVYNDIMQFRRRKDWYRQKGIPYRRGYFLCGPPGNGKSSLVLALAGKLEMDVAILPLAWTSSDERLQDLLLDMPQGSLLLIEDIDKVKIDTTDTPTSEERSGITLSGLLNVLDGITAREDRIIFLTANEDRGLHSALLRPGRMDVRLAVGNASHYQTREMFNRFYGNENGLVDKFARHIPPGEVSMAALQEHFLRYKDQPDAAVANVGELLK